MLYDMLDECRVYGGDAMRARVVGAVDGLDMIVIDFAKGRSRRQPIRFVIPGFQRRLLLMEYQAGRVEDLVGREAQLYLAKNGLYVAFGAAKRAGAEDETRPLVAGRS